jgi:hypothetical protein
VSTVLSGQLGSVQAVGLVRGECGRCGVSWVGEDRCHCARCCQTWDDVELFDAHRSGDKCLHGRALGLLQTRNGIWLRPVDRLGTAS